MNTSNDTFKTLGNDAASVAHAVTQSTEHAMRAAQEGMERMSDGLSVARNQSGTALRQLAHQTEALAHEGAEAVREGAHQLREKSMQVKDATTTYIQHEPIKSVLIAAAVGATLMGLVAVFSRHGGNGR